MQDLGRLTKAGGTEKERYILISEIKKAVDNNDHDVENINYYLLRKMYKLPSICKVGLVK